MTIGRETTEPYGIESLITTITIPRITTRTTFVALGEPFPGPTIPCPFTQLYAENQTQGCYRPISSAPT